MDRIMTMRAFVRVVETGSFTKAATAMHMPIPSISRHIQALESHLGAKLFNRTTRLVRPTEDGFAYYERCVKLLIDLDDMEAAVGQAKRRPRGRLRVSVPATIANNILIPALDDFLEKQPEIKIDLVLSDKAIDMIENDIDCAIRVGDVVEADVVAKQIGVVPRIVCAAPSYLALYGEPVTLHDLGDHMSIAYFQDQKGRVRPWEFQVGGKLHPVHTKTVISVDNADCYVNCGLAGLGIIMASELSLRRYVATGELKRIMPRCQTVPRPISIVFWRDRHMPRKIRVFTDWFEALYASFERAGSI
jgi:LysR family transcriptional regulator for bpeEF and oprC